MEKNLSKHKEGYYLFDNFRKHNCLAAFSYGKIDLGFHNNPHLIDNRKNFLEKLKIDLEDLVCLKQVHKNKVFLAKEKDKGRGAQDYDSAVSGYDAIITSEKRLPLAVFTADCLPIFILDTKKKVAAIAHCGWRGTKDNILLSVLRILKNKFASRMLDIICAMGPRIGPCCYEVGSEFRDYFSYGIIKRGGRYFLDLAGINLRTLLGAGVLRKNIFGSKICTFCQRDFFSYRRDGSKTGRMMSVIMIDK